MDEHGEQIFFELFSNGTPQLDAITRALFNRENIALVGPAGCGKSCMLKYIDKYCNSKPGYHPVFLDLRNIDPFSEFNVVRNLIRKMKDYFKAINKPENRINEDTTTTNYEYHHSLIVDKLESIEESDPIPVIIIDDLDYYEANYHRFLMKHFSKIAVHPRTVVAIACRQPLFNSLKCNDETRNIFGVVPTRIPIPPYDAYNLIEARHRPYVNIEPNLSAISRFFAKYLNKNISVKDILRRRCAQSCGMAFDTEGKVSDVLDYPQVLGLDHAVFGEIYEFAGRNLRLVEDLLPEILECHNNRKSGPDFNTDLWGSMMTMMAELIDSQQRDDVKNISDVVEKEWLVDLFSETVSTKGNKPPSPVKLIVLEYLAYDCEVVDDQFYDSMQAFGIRRDIACEAIRVLSEENACIEPEYIFQIKNKKIFRNYSVSDRGWMYLRNIVQRKDYQALIGAPTEYRSMGVRYV